MKGGILMDKDKIVKMFLNGMKKGTICQKQHISPRKFDSIICRYLYYVKRKSVSEICKSLKFDEDSFNEFITIKRAAENQNVKQNGRSDWITKLTKRQKPVL
jgi:hypothetical protein